MDSLYRKASEMPGFMENFQKWREKNCPLVISGDGMGNCNQCPYPVCKEEFLIKFLKKNKKRNVEKNGNYIG